MVRHQERFAEAHPGAFDFHGAGPQTPPPSAGPQEATQSAGSYVLLDQKGRVIAKYG
jgi:hypothetical protein